MKHFVIITSTLSFLIIALSISYYFLVFLPKNIEQKQFERVAQSESELNYRKTLNHCTTNTATRMESVHPKSVNEFKQIEEMFFSQCMRANGYDY